MVKKKTPPAVFAYVGPAPDLSVMFVKGCVVEGSVKEPGKIETFPQAQAGFLLWKGWAVLSETAPELAANES